VSLFGIQGLLEEQGMGIREAVREATRTRLRPVMMSTITTVFGLSPLVLLTTFFKLAQRFSHAG
jgi:multidrug efflux pump subunit AcrB